MELAKIRSLSDEELAHQEKTTAEQLFRLRFQVSLGQNDGVKKLRQLRKEIAQIKTVARERELGAGAASRRGRGNKGWQREGSPLNDGDNRSSAGAGDWRAAQREGWPGGLDQDAEDHRGRGRDAQAARQVQEDHAHDKEVLCA